MLTHHALESAKSRLNPESHWLVNGSFLLTESLYTNYLSSVRRLWCTFVNPFCFLAVHPTLRIFWNTLGCTVTVHTGWRTLV